LNLKDFSLTGTVLLTELRSAVRDRHVVVYSLVLPIFLYPLLIWLLAQGAQYRSGALERQTSRLGWEGEDLLPGLFDRVRSDPRFEISAAAAETDVPAGLLDGFVRVRSDAAGAPSIEAVFDLSTDRSKTTRDRLREIWDSYRRTMMEEQASAFGASEALLGVIEIREVNVASPEEMGRFLLSLLLPMILVIMLAMGAMYPAIDVLVGEKERRTMESLLAAGAPRASFVAGKFLAVLAGSIAALLANLASMLLTLSHQASFFGEGEELSVAVPWSAIPAILGGGLLLGAFFSASMVLLASSARTFKEGQGYVTPFYILCLVPAVAGSSMGVEFTPLTALIPLMNGTLLFRSALLGDFPPAPIAITLLSLLVYLLAVLFLAERMLGSEALFLGGKGRMGFRRLRTARGGS
jgi:sodium transport system permease protein